MERSESSSVLARTLQRSEGKTNLFSVYLGWDRLFETFVSIAPKEKAAQYRLIEDDIKPLLFELAALESGIITPACVSHKHHSINNLEYFIHSCLPFKNTIEEAKQLVESFRKICIVAVPNDEDDEVMFEYGSLIDRQSDCSLHSAAGSSY
jgi:hypothetical protein